MEFRCQFCGKEDWLYKNTPYHTTEIKRHIKRCYKQYKEKKKVIDSRR